MTSPTTDPLEPRSAMQPAHQQVAWPIRFDWGPAGALALTAGSSGRQTIAVVVDVLSFSTTVCAALEAGGVVIPFSWRDARAAAYARAHDAVLAIGRDAARMHPPGDAAALSLSPLSMSSMPPGTRVVLPSPNGSHICARLAESPTTTVVAACLRNATATAAFIAAARPDTVAVIAAGERWPDDSLRPALEDLWGAGAVLHALAERMGPRTDELFSTEARFAADAFSATRRSVTQLLPQLASGRELVDKGFGEDVDFAAQADVTDVVAVLQDGEFTPAQGGAPRS